MTDRTDADLGSLLAQAGILMFEYDPDGYLTRALGSCLGADHPELEVRSGLVSPEVVRRTASGDVVVERVTVNGRLIALRHEPVRGADGATLRVVATALDISGVVRAHDAPVPGRLASLPAAS